MLGEKAHLVCFRQASISRRLIGQIVAVRVSGNGQRNGSEDHTAGVQSVEVRHELQESVGKQSDNPGDSHVTGTLAPTPWLIDLWTDPTHSQDPPPCPDALSRTQRKSTACGAGLGLVSPCSLGMVGDRGLALGFIHNRWEMIFAYHLLCPHSQRYTH